MKKVTGRSCGSEKPPLTGFVWSLRVLEFKTPFLQMYYSESSCQIVTLQGHSSVGRRNMPTCLYLGLHLISRVWPRMWKNQGHNVLLFDESLNFKDSHKTDGYLYMYNLYMFLDERPGTSIKILHFVVHGMCNSRDNF